VPRPLSHYARGKPCIRAIYYLDDYQLQATVEAVNGLLTSYIHEHLKPLSGTQIYSLDQGPLGYTTTERSGNYWLSITGGTGLGQQLKLLRELTVHAR
jgi:hypothetical protein